MKGDSSQEVEFRWFKKTGEECWATETIGPIKDGDGQVQAVQIIIQDITERKRAEEERDVLEKQLRQRQKMEAMGQLTAGIAHNFNNMLQGIMGNINYALSKPAEEIRPLLLEADAMSSRAAEMIDQLMVVARQGIKNEAEQVQINDLVDHAVEICRRTFDRKIRIVVETRGNPVVVGDANQLEQAFLNFMINARDALEEVNTRRVLEEGGYTVLLASDGDRGLETYRRHCEQIDLVLLDLSMPVMSGKEMLEELCTMEVQTKVIVFTGYATDASEMPGVGRVIRKPLRMNELAQAVRAVLDE